MFEQLGRPHAPILRRKNQFPRLATLAHKQVFQILGEEFCGVHQMFP
jgi:hypothetical protein